MTEVPKHYRVAACMILGDAYDKSEVKRTIESLSKAGIDEAFIAYNGEKGKQSLNWLFSAAKALSFQVTLEKFEWTDNFAAARQQSFNMVPKEKFDWLLWIDSDDVLVIDEGSLDEMFESLDEYTDGIFIRYAYAVDPDSGIVVVEQWRERFLKATGRWRWKHPIHEVCTAPAGTQFAKRDTVHIEHLRKSGDDRGARLRNRRIIAKALRENPEEKRHHFYFASEALAEAADCDDEQERVALIEGAILAFETYRAMEDGLSDDLYMATNRLAELCRLKGDHARALEYDMECIAIYPDWPDGYVGAARSCMELGDWRRMKAFATMAIQCKKPQTAAALEPLMAGFTPLFLRGIANEQLGNKEQAIADYTEAQTIWNPANEHLDEKLAALTKNVGTAEEPVEDERKKLRGTKPDKSICFFTAPLPFTWHPLADAGAGAERCVMELAPRFAADGWRVAVFGTPGEFRGVHEGVEYWNSDECIPSEKFSLFVSSRAVEPFETEIASKRSVLWMHDVNSGPGLIPVRQKMDKIIGLTNWHANHLRKLYGLPRSRMAVVGNGVHPERFPVGQWTNEESMRFIWSSSPDRGLDTVLALWPMIRERYPDAELHTYYGWDIIDKVIDHYRKQGTQHTQLETFKRQIYQQIEKSGGEEGGIFQHKRAHQDELATEQMKSLIWPYPTNFMETFCITAVEMQMAGVLPVAAKLAALTETVAPCHETISGWPLNSDFQSRWLGLLERTIESDDDWREENRQAGRAHAEQYTWEKSYTQWNDMISELDL